MKTYSYARVFITLFFVYFVQFSLGVAAFIAWVKKVDVPVLVLILMMIVSALYAMGLMAQLNTRLKVEFDEVQDEDE